MRAWAVIAAQRENLSDASNSATSDYVRPDTGLIEFPLLTMLVFLVDFSRSRSFDITPRESPISKENFCMVGGKTLLKGKASSSSPSESKLCEPEKLKPRVYR